MNQNFISPIDGQRHFKSKHKLSSGDFQVRVMTDLLEINVKNLVKWSLEAVFIPTFLISVCADV